MQLEKTADIKENEIAELDCELLSILLKDRSSGRNILWATDNYISRGISYAPSCPISVKQISGKCGKVIRPRIDKSKREQQVRIKDKAEVFTPSRVCCKQNNAADEDWFERKNVFNSENGQTWITSNDKITFPEGKTWQDYVLSRRLEITCGEAPYLCSRYDTTTGEWIEVGDRIGILDRKIRVISENTDSEQDWVAWVVKAYQSIYGYEWQGDSVLIARENLLYTFIDYYADRFGFYPIKEYLFEIAKIISWNIWQMDGHKCVIPNSCKPIMPMQLSLFDDEIEPQQCSGCEKNKVNLHTGIYCKIMNWRSKHSTKFVNLKGAKNMKFDYVIGNPPYQQESGGKIADDSVYSYFMDAAYSISNKVLLITPAKFLFNNGNTAVKWNEKMLNDVHFKVLFFEPVASKVFNNVSFKGGVAIHYRDTSRTYSPIIHYSEFSEMNSVLRKVLEHKEESLTTIIYNQNKFALTTLYENYPELKKIISSDGKERRLTSGCLSYPCFHINRESNDDIEILGVIKNKREHRFIDRKYIEEPHPNLDKYKAIVSANNGSGAIGEVISTPLIGVTQTFISIGAFNERYEAENVLKYVKSKFARTMLGVLKVTQNGKREMWKCVPLQDFTSNSDIDWSQSVAEIDVQLYRKYGLSQDEIDFIETHVKEMN